MMLFNRKHVLILYLSQPVHCLDVNQTVLRLMETCHGHTVKKLGEGYLII